jgi:hypothetical protein
LGSQERYGKTCISDVLGGGTKHLFRLNVTVSNAKLPKEKRGDAGKRGIKETIKSYLDECLKEGGSGRKEMCVQKTREETEEKRK